MFRRKGHLTVLGLLLAFGMMVSDAHAQTSRNVHGRQVSVPSDFGLGYEHGRAWVDFDLDGEDDYCRVGGDKPDHQVIFCTIFRSGRAHHTVDTVIGDWGYHHGRSWVDVTGDRYPEYCRMVGNPGTAFFICTVNKQGHDFGEDLRADQLNSLIPGWARRSPGAHEEKVRVQILGIAGGVPEFMWRGGAMCRTSSLNVYLVSNARREALPGRFETDLRSCLNEAAGAAGVASLLDFGATSAAALKTAFFACVARKGHELADSYAPYLEEEREATEWVSCL